METEEDENIVDEEEDDWLDTRWADPHDNLDLSSASTHTQQLISQDFQASASGSASKAEQKPSSSSLMTRMQLNDNKAGMEGLDKEKINQIIYEASKGSRYFENERKKEEQVEKRVDEQRMKQSHVTEAQLKQGLEEADKLLVELEESRDLTHTIVHIDMDAYYAAVEMREDPSLKDKPMAVGGKDMLSTSNYLARKFGVRAAMPGFIGQKLCPDLVIVKSNFAKYREVSDEVRQIMGQYDPNFSPMSLDEAYLDITSHLSRRQTSTETERSFLVRECDDTDASLCLCDLNEVLRLPGLRPGQLQPEKLRTDLQENKKSSIDSRAGVQTDQLADPEEQSIDISSSDVCQICKKPFPPYKVVVFGTSAEDAVEEMRMRIQQKTRLTASAGIAPNTMLAKVCSDKNKPNGQYRIMPVRQEVMSFIRDLPIRKISGIGKVSEKMLRALDIIKCQDLYEKRALLFHLYSQIAFHHFMRICLGIGSTTVERDSERKSMSTERTFRELSRPGDLYRKCSELCAALVEDLTDAELRGKTVTIKIKTVKFEVKTRAHSLKHHTAEYDDIFAAARELLRVEIQAVQPQPLRLRLMGVRLSNLQHQSLCDSKRQDTITGLFKKIAAKSPPKNKQGDVDCDFSHEEHQARRREDSLNKISLTASASSEIQNLKTDEQIEKRQRTDSRKINFDSVGVCENKDENEINNNCEISETSTTSDSSETQRASNSAAKRKKGMQTGRKKIFKNSNMIDSESCEDVKVQCDSSEKVEENMASMNQSAVSHKMKARNISEVNPMAHKDEDSRQEMNIQTLKSFHCPVCCQDVQCKNLNYFNDHVDVCLFKQISQSQEKELSTESASVDFEGESSEINGEIRCEELNSKEDLETREVSTDQKVSFSKVRGNDSVKNEMSTVSSSGENNREKKDAGDTNRQSGSIVLGMAEWPAIGQSKEKATGQNNLDNIESQADLPRETLEADYYACPICNVEKIGCSLEQFNEHVDSCLSRRAIKQILDEQKTVDNSVSKRSVPSPQQSASKKRKRENSGKMKTIDSFFKS